MTSARFIGHAVLVTIALILHNPATAATLTRDEAAARVLADGFTLVARTEATKVSRADDVASWDVWASKYGIAYHVTVDAITGTLTGATPAVEND